MIPAILIGRKGSKGFPGKNKFKVLDKELFLYPLEAVFHSLSVDHAWLSTDDIDLEEIVESTFYFDGLPISPLSLFTSIIDRPSELSTDSALADEVFLHAYNYILFATQDMENTVDLVVLLFANAPCINSKMIDEMVSTLSKDKEADSICTISKYNMFSPYRMRKKSDSKYIENFVECNNSDCDRNSQGDFYIYDCSCAVVRPRVLEDIENQPGPQRWLGKKILPYFQTIPALDVDFPWQIGQVEYWLKHHE